MKNCQNCANFVWGDFKTQIPKECIECEEVEAHPSNWKAKPQTNADSIRAMSDEELAEMFLSACVYREFCHGCPAEKEMPNCPGEILGKWEEWLKQPAEGE